MYNETIQPPETNDTIFLFGAEFARGRVCQGPRCPGILPRAVFLAGVKRAENQCIMTNQCLTIMV